MLGYPPTPPGGARRLTARPADPQGLGQPRGGKGSPPPFGGGWGSPPPPPYSPPSCRTPLGVTHWLAPAPVYHMLLGSRTYAMNCRCRHMSRQMTPSPHKPQRHHGSPN